MGSRSSFLMRIYSSGFSLNFSYMSWLSERIVANAFITTSPNMARKSLIEFDRALAPKPSSSQILSSTALTTLSASSCSVPNVAFRWAMRTLSNSSSSSLDSPALAPLLCSLLSRLIDLVDLCQVFGRGSSRNYAAMGRPSSAGLVHSNTRLGHRVVVAVAGTAAGRARIVGAGPLYQRPAGALRTPIAAGNGVSGHVAARLRRFQRGDRYVGGHAVGRRPADRHAGARVDGVGKAGPAPAGA